MTYEGKKWIRLASVYPEKIQRVDFTEMENILQELIMTHLRSTTSGTGFKVQQKEFNPERHGKQ